MFDHRLGLALGKSIGEIHALSYREYSDWQLYYLLEPWGWPNEEYAISTILAMLYNANRGKGKAKDVRDFQRRMLESALKELAEPIDPAEMPREELVKLIKKDFGIR
jgi:hypothetical protein